MMYLIERCRQGTHYSILVCLESTEWEGKRINTRKLYSELEKEAEIEDRIFNSEMKAGNCQQSIAMWSEY